MAGTSRGSTRSRASKSSIENPPIRNPNKMLRKDKTRNNSLIRIFSVNLKLLLGFGIVAFAIALFFIYPLINPMEKPQKLRVITPLPVPKLMDLPMFQGEHREGLYWGTYRPQVYFGVRARTLQSLVTGLMWLGVKNGRYFMRHVCQDSDELKQYGWTSHNGRDYGHQVLIEQTMTLTTSFLKSKDHSSGYGGDWAVRIGVQSDESVSDEEMLNTAHLFFYVADEGGKSLTLGSGVLDIHGDSILASGSHSDIGDWQLYLFSEDVSGVHYSGFKTPHIHNLSDLVQANLAVQARKFGHLLLSDSSDDSPNILVFQISARIPFKADIVFLSGTRTRDSRVAERASRLTGTSLTSLLSEKQKEFDNKFKKSFSLSDELGLEPVTAGKAALGNMLGGIGYFFGQSKISLPSTSTLNAGDNSVLYWPAELYTAVPSRPFFPRGFLWDEGFHQLLIWRWDIYISLDIIGHWLDLMNIDGWIPRELILGAEALSKVPEEFVLQHPTNGNPPTLFLALRGAILARIMARINLSRLCKQEEDYELGEVRCKPGFVLPLLTSWTPRNPGRRYWNCPYYGNARSCDFWLWKDDYIDPRSKFVIPKLLGRIGELEQSVESFEKVDDTRTRTTNSVESKVDMNKIEMQLDNFEDDLKKMKVNEIKWRSKLTKSKKREKQLWITLVCVCILGISFVFQNHYLNGYPRRLP